MKSSSLSEIKMSLRLTQLSLLLSVLGALENLTVLATVFLFLLLWEKNKQEITVV